MATAAEEYLFPRVCPILAVSNEDLVDAIETYGRQVSFEALASLIVKNYDFPYARYGDPRVPAPSTMRPPRIECPTAPTPAPPGMLLGGYRCTRMGVTFHNSGVSRELSSSSSSSCARIPGIGLLMSDSVSRLDWTFDAFMEPHRMRCWVAIQGKAQRWADGRNDLRSPYMRSSHVASLAKLLDSELINAAGSSKRTASSGGELLTHASLRDILLGSNEAIPPTAELYLRTIDKLNPTSISMPVVGYGVGIAAMVCIASPEVPCSYDLSAMTEEASKSIRDFVQLADRPMMREVAAIPTPSPQIADLIFLDIIPYGTHDLRAYLGEKMSPRYLSYPQYIRKILRPLRLLIEEVSRHPAKPTTRIALVISLRELPTLPTIEPILLAILADEQLSSHISLAGALVSQKRDYAVYLMRLQGSVITRQQDDGSRAMWHERLRQLYPEISLAEGDEELVVVLQSAATTSRNRSGAGHSSSAQQHPEPWDEACLKAVSSELISDEPDRSGISLQGARTVRGKATFPTRTRTRAILSETNNLETGDVAYVFGSIIEPLLPLPVTTAVTNHTAAVELSSAGEAADTLIARMVSGIRGNLQQQSEGATTSAVE